MPVFNMLTAGHHPCQVLADLLTLREAFGALEGLKLAYVGDGNNVARSLAVLGALAGVEVVVSAPPATSSRACENVADPAAAVAGPHAVYADVWVSMGDEATADARRAALAPYRIDDALLDRAAPGAIALHCLPAHPGEEIPRRSSTARASASGTRPRTAATRRRRCSNGCSLRRHRPHVRDDAGHRPAHRRAHLGGARRRAHRAERGRGNG